MNKILMKKKQSQWKKLLISLVLLGVTIILSVVLLPVGIIYTLGMILDRIFNPTSNSSGRKAIGYLASTIRSVAVGIDQIGNVICRDLFNNILITGNGYKFGNVQETISSVLGHNQIDGTLSKTGKRVVKMLDRIEKDHCKKSIIYFS